MKAFLDTVHECLDAGRVELLSRRDKNRATLLRLGFTSAAAKAELRHLAVEDYIAGPKPAEHGRPGVVWEFVRAVAGVPVYIKLTVTVMGNGPTAICISFHEPEFGYTRPFAQKVYRADDDDDDI